MEDISDYTPIGTVGVNSLHVSSHTNLGCYTRAAQKLITHQSDLQSTSSLAVDRFAGEGLPEPNDAID